MAPTPGSSSERKETLKCPSCGVENLLGEDRCEQCLHSLMTVDLPRPKKGEKIQQIMMTAPISELVTGRDLLVAKTTDTVEKVLRIFQEKEKDCVLVFKKKKLVGIFAIRDVVYKVAGQFEDLSKVTLQSVMTPNPEFVRAEHPIAFAVNKMAMGGFRHIPVLSADGQPLSIITIRDVLCYLDRRDEES